MKATKGRVRLMYKVAVMGDRDSVAAFSALGFDTFEITDGRAATKKLRELAADYGIIYITEKLASFCEKEIQNMKDNITPTVILIPGTTGNTGKGMESLNQSVERAVGKNIL